MFSWVLIQEKNGSVETHVPSSGSVRGCVGGGGQIPP